MPRARGPASSPTRIGPPARATPKEGLGRRRPAAMMLRVADVPIAADTDPEPKQLHQRFVIGAALTTLYVCADYRRSVSPPEASRKVEPHRSHATRPASLASRGRPRRAGPSPSARSAPERLLRHGHERQGRVPRAVPERPRAVLWRALRDGFAGDAPGRRAEGGGFMLVIRGLAHMDARLERSAATARRVVPRGAAPMYAMAKVARLAQRRPGAPG